VFISSLSSSSSPDKNRLILASAKISLHMSTEPVALGDTRLALDAMTFLLGDDDYDLVMIG